MATQTHSRADDTRMLQAIMRDLGISFGSRQVRYRFASQHSHRWTFGKRGRRIFCYSTARLADGKFASWDYVCQAKGGPLAKRAEVRHSTRKAALARAHRRFSNFIMAQAKTP